MSDRDLVDAIIIKKEEDAAFCLFHHKLIKFFGQLANSFSKLRYSAGDIASEMYIDISNNNWKKLRTFEFRSSLFTWVKSVTNRFLINKSKYMIDEVFFTSLIEIRDGEEYDPMENIPDLNQRLKEVMRNDAELIEELYKAIDLLSPYMREIVRLRCLLGLSAKETAEILCKSGKIITPGAVDQVLKRAKDILRKKLLGEKE
jgi:RNA polymerase sigma factor (sigma-70 family)